MADAKPPSFALITITLNNLEGLKRTEKSVHTQTCGDYTWLVMDGASTDGTLEYLKQLPNMNWHSAPDNGIYDAMNKALRALENQKSNADYILFLNAGDALAAPDTLGRLQSRLMKYRVKHGALPDFVYGDAMETRPDGGAPHYKPARAHSAINFGMFTHHQAMLYRRQKLAGLQFNTDYKIAADFDLTARFLKESERCLYCPMPICLFEAGGLSQKQARIGRNEQFMARRNLGLISPPMNLLVLLFQGVVWELRRRAPSLYWRLKSSGNSASGSAPEKIPTGRPKTQP